MNKQRLPTAVSGGVVKASEMGLRGKTRRRDVARAVTHATHLKLPLLFDRDCVLTGDILIAAPVHIIVSAGVTITMADAPVWSHGVHLQGRSTYYCGMFTFRPGGDGDR